MSAIVRGIRLASSLAAASCVLLFHPPLFALRFSPHLVLRDPLSRSSLGRPIGLLLPPGVLPLLFPGGAFVAGLFLPRCHFVAWHSSPLSGSSISSRCFGMRPVSVSGVGGQFAQPCGGQACGPAREAVFGLGLHSMGFHLRFSDFRKRASLCSLPPRSMLARMPAISSLILAVIRLTSRRDAGTRPRRHADRRRRPQHGLFARPSSPRGPRPRPALPCSKALVAEAEEPVLTALLMISNARPPRETLGLWPWVLGLGVSCLATAPGLLANFPLVARVFAFVFFGPFAAAGCRMLGCFERYSALISPHGRA